MSHLSPSGVCDHLSFHPSPWRSLIERQTTYFSPYKSGPLTTSQRLKGFPYIITMITITIIVLLAINIIIAVAEVVVIITVRIYIFGVGIYSTTIVVEEENIDPFMSSDGTQAHIPCRPSSSLGTLLRHEPLQLLLGRSPCTEQKRTRVTPVKSKMPTSNVPSHPQIKVRAG